MSGPRDVRQVRISSEEIKSTYVEWLKEDLKRGPSEGEALGRFLFGVSSGGIATLVAVSRIAKGETSLDPAALVLIAFGIILFLGSAFVALRLAIPPFVHFDKLMRNPVDVGFFEKLKESKDRLNPRNQEANDDVEGNNGGNYDLKLPAHYEKQMNAIHSRLSWWTWLAFFASAIGAFGLLIESREPNPNGGQTNHEEVEKSQQANPSDERTKDE